MLAYNVCDADPAFSSRVSTAWQTLNEVVPKQWQPVIFQNYDKPDHANSHTHRLDQL